MSLTRADWNKFLWRQQNEVAYWEKMLKKVEENNESLKKIYAQALKVELRLLEKIRKEMNKCK